MNEHFILIDIIEFILCKDVALAVNRWLIVSPIVKSQRTNEHQRCSSSCTPSRFSLLKSSTKKNGKIFVKTIFHFETFSLIFQSALFNFQSLMVVILLMICTCTYIHDFYPTFLNRYKHGFVWRRSMKKMFEICF